MGGALSFRVDFVKYPSLKDVEYYNVTMEPGDCLFIPYKWWVVTDFWVNVKKM